MQYIKRKNLIFALDILILLVVYLVGIILMKATDGPERTAIQACLYFLIFAGSILLSRICFKVYTNVWRYADAAVYTRTIIADAIGGVVGIAIVMLPVVGQVNIGFWKNLTFVAVFDIATLFSRFIYKIVYERSHNVKAGKERRIRVAIAGAGQIGTLLAQELLYNKASNYYPVCFIDKDKNKVGSKILGLEVYPEWDAVECLKDLSVKEIIFAISNISSEEIRDLTEKYASEGYGVKIYDAPLSDEGNDKRVIREIKIEDLLFRSSIQVIDEQTRAYYSGKTVLVTGGGGSIGSELCRQIADCRPARLVIFDIYENNAYDIQQELIRKYGDDLNLVVEIGSVRDRARLEAVFAEHRPEIVIHAAAHKHVPLMERSNAEAIKNNTFGTYNTADMAEKYGTKKFILISTDKAVNPTNVMGASKRLCEMVVQCRRDSETDFCAVRFGNVLGSNGSVIPLFKRQIEAGGPVTLTDKRIIRYFMTIPEASGLVMTAGSMASRGELFVLDMGKPVRIVDLAENMIRLSGYEPYSEIDIVEIGLRPGEKLYEELLIDKTSMDKTDNNLIFIEHDAPLTREQVEAKLDLLRNVITATEHNVSDLSVTETIKQVVPTFRDPAKVNATATSSAEMKMTAKV